MNTTNPRVLILHKPFNETGGVGTLFSSLGKHFPSTVEHFIVGSRENESLLGRMISFPKDYINFLRLINNNHYDIIHINLVFDLKASIRDGIFLFLSKKRCGKIIVFIHGWDDKFLRSLKGFKKTIFFSIFKLCDLFIVLSKRRVLSLTELNFSQRIKTFNTAVDNELLNGFDLQTITIRQSILPFKILFLSRIIKEKGIYEALDAISIIQQQGNLPIELIIAGSGNELENSIKYTFKNKLTNVKHIGYVRGKDKAECFKNAYLYLFPSYNEGMPISVLEAMAFGLPVITRNVGGLTDFFQNEYHGFITDSFEPKVFANYIQILCNDKMLYEKISINNYNYAQEHFMASKVAQEQLRIYDKLWNNDF